jgi:hypothetical protein
MIPSYQYVQAGCVAIYMYIYICDLGCFGESAESSTA